jgi:hypothetical protein
MHGSKLCSFPLVLYGIANTLRHRMPDSTEATRFSLYLLSGIPMQVVVPSVSRAAALHGAAFTTSVEIPSFATLSSPVRESGKNGSPGCGASGPGAGSCTDADGTAGAGAVLPVVCCARAAEPKVSSATKHKAALRIDLLLMVICVNSASDIVA